MFGAVGLCTPQGENQVWGCIQEYLTLFHWLSKKNCLYFSKSEFLCYLSTAFFIEFHKGKLLNLSQLIIIINWDKFKK